MPDNEPFYYDKYIVDFIPDWEQYSPEEYIARNWLNFGTFTLSDNTFENKKLELWVKRFEEIFHDSDMIEESRRSYLSDSEYAEQEKSIGEPL